jgi:hypothetical protein
MGQCLSTGNPPSISGFGHHQQNPAPYVQAPAAGPSIPSAPPQAPISRTQPASYQPPKPGARNLNPPQAPLNLQNRYVDWLCENKDDFPPEQQQAIDHLKTYDDKKHQGLKNRDLLLPPGFPIPSDKALRQAFNRTASFRLIDDVLADVAVNSEVIQCQEGTDKARTMFLLTGEMEAVKHQVAIGKNEIRQKIRRGERISPMLMEKAKFANFLHFEDHTIGEIIQSCRTFGEARNQRLTASLTKLGQNYLRSTNRLPCGLKPGQFADIGSVRITDERLKVHVGPGLSAVSVYKEDDTKTAAILIDPEDVTAPADDPADCNKDGPYYGLGFEHCGIPEKQAAYFIQQMFTALQHVELTVAEERGCRPGATPQEARTAALSYADREYNGAELVGDRCDKAGTDPEDQRKETVDAAIGARNVAQSFPFLNGGQSLFVESDIDSWVQSPQFEEDLVGLRHPELRALTLGVDSIKEGLLNTRHFARQRR